MHWISLMSMSIDYENPWIYNGKAFESSDIGDHFGFVYCIACNETKREYIGRKYFWKFRTPKGKKRKVKSESDWKKYYGCLLYTSPSPRDGCRSRMPSSA